MQFLFLPQKQFGIFHKEMINIGGSINQLQSTGFQLRFLWCYPLNINALCFGRRFNCVFTSLTRPRFTWPCGVLAGVLDPELAGLISVDVEPTESHVDSSVLVIGPNMERIVGKKTRPWNNPNKTVNTKTLKNVTKTWEVEAPSRTNARNVVMPPLNTAGPIVAMACTAFSFLEP